MPGNLTYLDLCAELERLGGLDGALLAAHGVGTAGGEVVEEVEHRALCRPFAKFPGPLEAPRVEVVVARPPLPRQLQQEVPQRPLVVAPTPAGSSQQLHLLLEA